MLFRSYYLKTNAKINKADDYIFTYNMDARVFMQNLMIAPDPEAKSQFTAANCSSEEMVCANVHSTSNGNNNGTFCNPSPLCVLFCGEFLLKTF